MYPIKAHLNPVWGAPADKLLLENNNILWVCVSLDGNSIGGRSSRLT